MFFCFCFYSILYMHIFLAILFGLLSFSYFALFVSTHLNMKPFTISLYMCIVTVKAYSILFYSILFYKLVSSVSRAASGLDWKLWAPGRLPIMLIYPDKVLNHLLKDARIYEMTSSLFRHFLWENTDPPLKSPQPLLECYPHPRLKVNPHLGLMHLSHISCTVKAI